jgi:hypothetical protein
MSTATITILPIMIAVNANDRYSKAIASFYPRRKTPMRRSFSRLTSRFANALVRATPSQY